MKIKEKQATREVYPDFLVWLVVLFSILLIMDGMVQSINFRIRENTLHNESFYFLVTQRVFYTLILFDYYTMTFSKTQAFFSGK